MSQVLLQSSVEHPFASMEKLARTGYVCCGQGMLFDPFGLQGGTLGEEAEARVSIVQFKEAHLWWDPFAVKSCGLLGNEAQAGHARHPCLTPLQSVEFRLDFTWALLGLTLERLQRRQCQGAPLLALPTLRARIGEASSMAVGIQALLQDVKERLALGAEPTRRASGIGGELLECHLQLTRIDEMLCEMHGGSSVLHDSVGACANLWFLMGKSVMEGHLEK